MLNPENTFGKVIRSLAALQGVPLADVASRVGVSPAEFEALLDDPAPPPLDVGLRILTPLCGERESLAALGVIHLLPPGSPVPARSDDGPPLH